MQQRIFKSMTRLATRETASSNIKQLMQHGETLPILASKASLHCEVLRRGYSPDCLPEMKRGRPRHVSGRRIASLESRRSESPQLCGPASRKALTLQYWDRSGCAEECAAAFARPSAFAYAYREDAVAAHIFRASLQQKWGIRGHVVPHHRDPDT
jgi:hypothetical protein